MGTSKSPFEYAAKMAVAARAAGEAGKAGTEAGAFLVKRTILARTPSRLSGVGKKGQKLGVRYTVTDSEGGAKALIFATGPFQLIERDTKAHLIPKARTRGRRRYAVIPGVGVFSSVQHPGTKGKHPFEKGVAEAAPLVPKAYALALEVELRAIF